MVLGVGGYSAGPVVAAAWLLGIPTALHEQNQLPGSPTGCCDASSTASI